MITGRPISATTTRASSSVWAVPPSGHVEADLDHRLLELVAILGGGDRLGVGADHLRRARHADQTALVQLHRHVEAGLAAERRQHRVGPLALDDRRQRPPSVSGSMYVASAKSGSVMIVAGFELARMTR